MDAKLDLKRVRETKRVALEGADGLGTNINAALGSQETYDFERLERSVEFLVEEHQRLTGERTALLDELVEREQRIRSLETQLAQERTRRASAVEGVDKILGRLEQLQTSVVSAMEPA